MSEFCDPQGLISVIMPVYNAEKTLAASAESVLKQSWPNIELILVDDGSTDGSLRICRQLEREDPRVRVLTQSNQGPAIARNRGMQIMKGEFVMFSDSDDKLASDACLLLAQAMGGNDLVIGHYYFVVGHAEMKKGLLEGNRSLTCECFLDELVKRPGSFYFSALWNKMYRAELIRSRNLSFDPFLSWGEDFAFNLQYYAGISHGVSLVEEPVYHYIKSPVSTSVRTLIHVVHSCQIKRRLYQHLKALYTEKGLYSRYQRQIHRYIWNVTLAD